MLRSHPSRPLLVAAIVFAATALSAGAEPLFTLSDDGRTFLYRARPGDHPALVAEMFGIPPRDVPGFLAANGITDPTRVGAGFAYRIPNQAARVLADRGATLENENASLRRTLEEERRRTQTL